MKLEITQGYLPAEDAAKLFGVTKNCLARWRSQKAGPPYYRLAGRIYYKDEDLETFIEQSRIVTAPSRTAQVVQIKQPIG